MRQVITYNNKNWTLPEPVDYWFRFEAIEDSLIGFYILSEKSHFEYSLNNKRTWITCSASTEILLNAGKTVHFRGKLSGNLSSSDYTQFVITGLVSCKGNIMYLYNYEQPNLKTISYEYAFYGLFNNCESLTTAPELPATTLSPSCYRTMFRYCTNLTTAPELPAVIVPNYGYRTMFNNCSKLNKIICYANSLGNNALTDWVNSVSSTGNFYKLGTANFPSGNNGIPSNWTVHTSLN